MVPSLAVSVTAAPSKTTAPVGMLAVGEAACGWNLYVNVDTWPPSPPLTTTMARTATAASGLPDSVNPLPAMVDDEADAHSYVV